MKVLNYISSICGGELWKIVKRNPLAWIVFGLLLLLNWKISLLYYLVPLLILYWLERDKKKKKEDDWNIIVTPIINLTAALLILFILALTWLEDQSAKMRP